MGHGTLLRPNGGWAYASLMTGIAALTFGTIEAGKPSYWTDEAATILSATRSWGSLWPMLLHVDAVHGVYYMLVHIWISLVGMGSPAMLRLSSGLAVGAAAAVTVLIARELGWTIPWAIAGGLALAGLPRMFLAAANVRSEALSVACSTLIVVLWLRAEHLGGRRRWLFHALALGIGIWIFAFTVLLLPVEILGRTLQRHDRPASSRSGWRNLFLSQGLGVLLGLPLLLLAYLERGQIAFLSSRGELTAHTLFTTPWFGAVPLSMLAWAVILWGIFRTARSKDIGERFQTLMLSSWLVVPGTVLVLFSILSTPMYTARYIALSSPAAALLLVSGIRTFRTTRTRVLLSVLLVVFLLPVLALERTAISVHSRADWSSVASFFQRQARPGDTVIYDIWVRPSWSPRNVSRLYPELVPNIRDIGLRRSWHCAPGLWDEPRTLPETVRRIGSAQRIWTVVVNEQKIHGRNQHSEARLAEVLRRRGYRVSERRQFPLDTIVLWTRTSDGMTR